MQTPTNNLRATLGLVLALLGGSLSFIVPALCQGAPYAGQNAAAQAAAANWIATGSLNVARSGHTATLLLNGKVLVAGGGSTAPLASAELYDPANRTWNLTGSMIAPRVLHTATLLSSGKVLVVGGHTSASPPTFGANTAELYDPATGTWTRTGNLNAASFWNTATLLQNGRVLVAGGFDSDNVKTAELYDPATGTWSLTGSLITPRYGQTATLLHDGRVLVARGSDDGDLASTLASAELYDPVAGTWNATPRASTAGSVLHTATLLPNGKVLVVGGNGGGIGGDTILALSELFDPATRGWSAAGNLAAARYAHTATLLPTGDVLVAGGTSQENHYPNLKYNSLDSAEIYDSNTGAWTSTASLGSARGDHTATLLADGRVLVAGGSIVGPSYTTIVLNSAELYGAAPLPGTIGPGYTGSWYDPAQSGHGLFVEVLSDNRFYASWFAFNPAGTQQAWITGVGTYSGNTATITAVDMPAGGRWIPNFDPNQVVRNAWGTLTFAFTDCDHGRVDFNSVAGYGTGSMNLTRLTQPTGLRCP